MENVGIDLNPVPYKQQRCFDNSLCRRSFCPGSRKKSFSTSDPTTKDFLTKFLDLQKSFLSAFTTRKELFSGASLSICL